MAKHQETKRTPTPYRVYSDSELKDFDQKIQRFYKDKIQTDGSTLKILDFNELAVAYGAFVKRDAGNGKVYYLRAKHDGFGLTRFEQLDNLMSQYDQWRMKGETKKEFAIQKSFDSYEKEETGETEVIF